MIAETNFREAERLPCQFELTFKESFECGQPVVSVFMDGATLVGDRINDNAYEEDFYRYHDIFHYSFATLLDWSPCTRALMKRKRKSDPLVDKVEDGAKATITEEAISLIVFNEAKENAFYANSSVSDATLTVIKSITAGFEVKEKTKEEWKQAIDAAYSIFRKVIKNRGGRVLFDRENKTVKYLLHPPATTIKIITKGEAPRPTIVFDTYWKFAVERQNIFYRRLLHPQDYPWTHDSILSKFKFTNAYRVTDRVSQYLLSSVILKGNQDKAEVVFRTLLFKLFNKIETWEYLLGKVGEIRYANFDFQVFAQALTALKAKGVPVYSNAYIMASGKSFFGYEFKHENHLKLVELMMKDLPSALDQCRTMQEAYEKLLSYPTIGTFLAYQYVTDLNYSDVTQFSEMEFVKAGPGAKDGLRKCFSHLGSYSEEDIIRMVCDNQEKEFERLELTFKSLWGRPLQLIDCQNLFCEVDKYARAVHPEFSGASNRTRIKQKFQPTSFVPINYVFPQKWNIKAE